MRSSYVVLREDHLHPPGTEPTTPQGEPRPHKGKPRAAHSRPVGRAAPQAQSVAQLSGGTGGLGHTSENRPGGNGPWAHRSVHGVTEVFMGSPKCPRGPDPPWEPPTLHEGPRTKEPYGAQPS